MVCNGSGLIYNYYYYYYYYCFSKIIILESSFVKLFFCLFRIIFVEKSFSIDESYIYLQMKVGFN